MKKIETICVFGDSTGWGAWDSEKGGWVNRLWLHVAEAPADDYAAFYNLSISGGTTETILARFENEAKIREADALIFQTGGNDASCEHGTNIHRVSPEKFAENLETIIKKARAITPEIIFVGFKNCDESKTRPVSWINIDYTNENIERYSKIMEEVCQRNQIPFISLFGLLNNDDFEDGLHPNAAGHEKIFVNVRKFLMDRKWI